MSKNPLKILLKWSAPLIGLEFLLFLIFYQFFAYLFVVLGILSTVGLTIFGVYIFFKRYSTIFD